MKGGLIMANKKLTKQEKLELELFNPNLSKKRKKELKNKLKKYGWS